MSTVKKSLGCLGVAIIFSLTAFLLFGIFSLLSGFFAGMSEDIEQTATAQVKQQANPIIKISENIVTITNNDSFDYKNAEFTIILPSLKLYSLHSGTIKQGETKKYQLSQFTDSDGKRFNIYQYEIDKILLDSENAEAGVQF